MNTRLFIGGLNFRTTQAALIARIEEIAPIAMREYTDRNTGETRQAPNAQIVEERFEVDGRMERRSKGFGFVEMATREGADAVMRELNGQEFDGRRLKVDWAQERQPRPEGGFRDGGNRGGDRGGSNFGGSRGGNNYGTSRNDAPSNTADAFVGTEE